MHSRDVGSPAPVAAARPGVPRPSVAALAPIVQRQVVVQRDVTDDKDFAAAAADPSRRREAVVYLGQHPDAAKNAELDLATVEAMLPLVGPTEHTARGNLLERGFVITTKKSANWEKAARFIVVLDDPGIDRNLATLNDKEAKLLAKGARSAPDSGATDERLMGRIRSKIKREAPGQLFGKVTATLEPHDGDADRHVRFSCRARIVFEPDGDVVDATKIAFVQTLRLTKTSAYSWLPARSQDDRKGVSDRLNKNKEAVDRAPTFKYGWYGRANDGNFPPPTHDRGVTPGVVENGVMKQAAELIDTPDGKDGDRTFQYETSVIALEGGDSAAGAGSGGKGFVYAVVLWGFDVDDDLKVKPHKVEYRQVPTAGFGTAVAAWNAQARSSTSRATPDQEVLPVFRLADTGAALPAHAPPQLNLRAVDPASRGRYAGALQRAAGNHATQRLLAPVQRCGGEVHEGCACAEEPVQRKEVVQRDDKKGPFTGARDEFVATLHKAEYDAIQGLPMGALLPRVAALSDEVRKDEAAAQASGGARLVAALKAVAAKGKPWQEYFENNNAAVSGLPPDQIGDIVRFLGGPKDAAYYRADQIKAPGGGKFDGAVDPDAGLVTLFFRVRFDADAVRWGGAPPGTPQAEQENREGLAKFKVDFKRVIESSWSFKGRVKATCPIAGKPALQTKVVVTCVDSGEHAIFHLFSAGMEGRDNAGPGEGNLKITSVEQGKPVTKGVSDPTGKHPEQVTTTQIPAAHEFGHALGLQHPHCKGGDDNCYGVTAEERRDIMGAGNLLQVIKRGKETVHDDFAPFEAIGKAWGDTHLTGASAACNVWTAIT